MIEFNPKSARHLSLLFFGGTLPCTEKLPVLDTQGNPTKFKSGKKKGEIKYRNEVVQKKIKGLKVRRIKSWKTETEGVYQTNEAILTVLASRPETETGQVASLMLEIRDLNKQIGTYYDGTERFIHSFDSCVHTQLCHFGYEKRKKGDLGGGTSTGRLSSTDPNMQNQPGKPSRAKYHFTSRFKNGKIIEFDYKQIEVYVFAFLTQDYQLLKDLREGVDIHRVMYSNCYAVPVDSVTSDQRKGIKACTFHVIYGGGAKSMAKRMGLDVEFCKKFIVEFYKRYPQAKQWQDRLVKIVESTAKYNGKKTKKGEPQKEGYYKSITGRKYIFKTTDSPDFMIEKGILTSFNPPDIKNFPVQGLATGDIVLIMIGALFRKVVSYRYNFLILNTVHDSLVVDCRLEHVQECIQIIKKELENVRAVMLKYFKIDFNLDVQVDVKVGESWAECS